MQLGPGWAVPEVWLSPPGQPDHLGVAGVGRSVAQRRQARLHHIRPVHDLIVEGAWPAPQVDQLVCSVTQAAQALRREMTP